jgi:2-keto-4-pentenoate hydratase/2-oxohepta-3-ene-1,7-dioic acid hydratase in catechol pathway
MKFVRYQAKDRSSFGLWEEDTIREIRGSIFDQYEITQTCHAVSDVHLLAPVEPSKIICVGLNYREHIKEISRETPEFPSHFLKPPTAFIGPEDPILYPRVAKRVDYEGELALIIKDRTKDVTEAAAADHIFGYTCLNDVTERSVSKLFGQLTRAKGFDTFAAFGPCIETELDAGNAMVRTFLNGKLVQEGNTGDMMFSAAYLVHYISQCMTLLPGDIISTGTPKGVSPMQPGDIVEVSIEGVGVLRNPVKADF